MLKLLLIVVANILFLNVGHAVDILSTAENTFFRNDDPTRVGLEIEFSGLSIEKAIQIVQQEFPVKVEIKEPEIKVLQEKVDAVVLFSGGLDSIAGLEFIKKDFKKVKYVFVNNQVPKTSKFVRQLQRDMGLGDDLIIFQTQPGGKFLQQTRGFSFLTAAYVVADIFKAENIIISECGVTKYQPSINIADEITKTTHPLMITLATALFENLNLKKKVHFPFDLNTKAEIIATVKNPNSLINSRSCRYSNISNELKPECGHCFGCLLKHISLVFVTGKKQNQFLLDPITNKSDAVESNLGKEWRLTTKRYEPVMSLISFCETILADISCLPETTQQQLNQHGTQDLFKRHAEDMVYGLMYMKQEGLVKNEFVLKRLIKIETAVWFDAKQISIRRKRILSKK